MSFTANINEKENVWNEINNCAQSFNPWFHNREIIDVINGVLEAVISGARMKFLSKQDFKIIFPKNYLFLSHRITITISCIWLQRIRYHHPIGSK